MLTREEVVTTYVNLLGRAPETEDVIGAHQSAHTALDSLVASIKGSAEFRGRQVTAASITREQVIAAYRTYLRRAPESEAVIQQNIVGHSSIESLEAALKCSEEHQRLQTFSTARRIKLNEIEAEVSKLERLYVEDRARYAASLNDFWLELEPIDADPRSKAYSDWVMSTYSLIANRPYGTANEVTPYDIESYVRRPAPYSSGDAAAIGDYLMAIGHVIRAMDLPPASSILEMGFGWGNTTVPLAMSGYKVKGIDISPHLVEIAGRRARATGLDVDLSVGDFFDVETIDDQFDAVLFFECFHHCADHVRLLKAIPRVLKPGGRLVLAGETINNALPYPWGINPDGQAVYCIRHHGWLELSFREDYILELLDSLGWEVVKHNFINAMGVTYVATRKPD